MLIATVLMATMYTAMVFALAELWSTIPTARAGLAVEDTKGECNLGQHEINFRFDRALTTADGHAIYKNGAKENLSLRADEGAPVFADHEVRLVPDSLAARAAGSERTPAKSHHHQGIKEVGGGLKVTGWAVEDDAIEALEDPSCPFVLGVLWHPEEDENSQLIKALVSEVS